MNPHTSKKLAEADSFSPQSGTLHASNQGFHQTYNRLVDDSMRRLGDAIPVIVLLGDDLHLLINGDEHSGRILSEQYHQLKSFGHIAFGVQLTLMAADNEPLDKQLIDELDQKLSQLRASHAPIGQLPADVRPVLTSLLDLSINAIERVQVDRRVDPTLLQKYSADLRPPVQSLSAFAVRLEIDALHALVSSWHQHLDDDKWRSLHVVICDNHQPRYRHAALQYFGRLLHEREGIAAQYEDRIVYGEGVQTIDAARDLLARHLIDQRASQMIFDDKSRLQKDLLADAATEYLDHLFPNSA